LTIDPWETFLHPKTDAFDGKGFTFTPLSPSSELRPVCRNSGEICYFHPRPWGQSRNLITIPPLDSSEPFVITHHLRHYPMPRDERVEASAEETPQESAMRVLIEIHDQTYGLKVGESYEIRFGDSWTVVRYWRRWEEGTLVGRARSWWMGEEDGRLGGRPWVDGHGEN
jgi:hypothetical protein